MLPWHRARCAPPAPPFPRSRSAPRFPQASPASFPPSPRSPSTTRPRSPSHLPPSRPHRSCPRRSQPTKTEPAASLEQVRALAAERAAQQVARQAAERQDKRLAYDPALIAAIGNQSAGGHTICCPAYACAYGDAVLTGQANDHGTYGCGCCTWPGWGGGDSSFRSLGSDEALLREAYDEIAAGRPTVIHVAGPYGEHWICLMGYQNVEDPDALTLDNFIALDPSNGQEVGRVLPLRALRRRLRARDRTSASGAAASDKRGGAGGSLRATRSVTTSSGPSSSHSKGDAGS